MDFVFAKKQFFCQTTGNSQSYYIGFVDLMTVYRKLEKAPEIAPSNFNDPKFPDWNNPVNLAKYIISVWKTHYNQNQNVHLHDRDYVGFAEADAGSEQFLTGIPEVFTVSTPVRQIRLTSVYDPYLVTDVYTGDPVTNDGIFSYATPGSTITFSGFTGVLSALNGTFVNGVALFEGGSVPNPRSYAVDSGPNGSFNDVYNHFLFNFDTSDPVYQTAPGYDPTTNTIKLPPGVTITVKHQFLPNIWSMLPFMPPSQPCFIQFTVLAHITFITFLLYLTLLCYIQPGKS